VWFLGLVIVTLLIVGGVEQNPGPLSEREKEIFEFIKKTGEKEVKGTLEIIQMSLSALQSAINLVSSKLDENKAVKDLTDSMTSVQMVVDNVKLRLEQCEKKMTKAQLALERNNLIIFGLDEAKNEKKNKEIWQKLGLYLSRYRGKWERMIKKNECDDMSNLD
jgi:hypothetical protein